MKDGKNGKIDSSNLMKIVDFVGVLIPGPGRNKPGFRLGILSGVPF